MPDGGVKLFNKALLGILIVVLLSAVAMLVYTIATPVETKFTEFYLLGADGKAEDYPDILVPGEEGRVLVGIANREQSEGVYRLEVMIDGAVINEVGPITLGPNEKWEKVLSLVPGRSGAKQKIEYFLYRQGQDEPYHRLHLWLDVQ